MDTRKLTTLSAFGSGLLCLGLAIAPPFDTKVQYRIGDRIGSAPSWLVPTGAEFKSLEPGYGSLKFPAALFGGGLMALSMSLARRHGAEEGTRQRIKQQRRKAEEAKSAIHHAYELQFEQAKCDAVFQARRLEFETQVEEAFVQSMGISPTLPALPGTTLDQVTNPGDKVREAEAKPAIRADAQADANASEPASTPSSNPASPGLPNLTNYPAVLVYGAPGSGKTTFSTEEIKRRLKAGHRVIVCDPHASFGSWQGCEVFGAGLDYAAIDKQLAWFAAEVKRRYQAIATQPNPRFQPLTLIADEFTNWAKRCESAGEFFQTCVTDIRKAEMYALIVSHTRTLAGLGDASGMAKLRDEALLEIELLGQLDPATGRAVPKFEGLVKLPGQSLSDRTLVKIPRNEARIDPREYDPEYFERMYNLEFDLNPDTRVPDSPGNCPVDPPDSPALTPDSSAKTDSPGQPESLPEAVSGFTWSVRKVREFYPDTTPEQLFQSVSASAQTPNVTARDIIKSILKCREGNDHPTRSYTRHGKTLLRWLIENYDDGAIASLPAIKKFLEEA